MNISMTEYASHDRTEIIKLMEEFQKYIEDIDDLKRTKHTNDAAEYFTDLMVRNAETKQGKVYIAKENETIVGFIAGYIKKQDEEERHETIPTISGQIIEFFVKQTHRRQQIGEKLMSKMEHYLKNQGCDIIRLSVFVPNIVARNFYHKHGYTDRTLSVLKMIK